jgi:hypothetical protein
VLPQLFALLVAAPAGAEPYGRDVEHALLVQIPPQGLRRLGDAVEMKLPERFPVLETSGNFECASGQSLTYTFGALDVLLDVDEVALTTTEDTLSFGFFATLSSTAGTLDVVGDCSVLEGLDETCGVELPVTALEAHVVVHLDTSGDRVDATVDPVELVISPITNPLSDCVLASAVGTAVGQNPNLLDDLITDAVTPALADIPATIEEAVEDALNGLAVDTEVDLLGTPLSLSLGTSRLEVSDVGLVVGMSASIAGDFEGTCADLSLLPEPLPTSWPILREVAPGTTLQHDAGVFIGETLVESLLHGVWASGLFCQDVEDLGDIPLQGGTIDAFFGGHVDELVGADAPARIVLAADTPPDVVFSEDQPVIQMELGELSLDLYSVLDGRLTRLAEVTVDARAGLDLGIEDGVLAPTLALRTEELRFEEGYSELLPPGFAENLPDLLEIVLDGLLPTDALAEVPVPAPLGVDPGEPFWIPTPGGSWLGAYLRLDLSGVTPVEVPGCSAEALGCGGSGGGVEFDLETALGCDDQSLGCGEEGGCSSIPARPVQALLLLPLVALRRWRRGPPAA